MKASIAHNIRPTALISGENSNKPWNQWDIVLAKAYQRFLNELCDQCGLPKYICHNDDPRIRVKLKRDECMVTERGEREQAKLGEAKTRTYGLRLGGEPYLSDEAVEAGLEMSDFRTPYLVDQAKRRGLLPDDFPVPVI